MICCGMTCIVGVRMKVGHSKKCWGAGDPVMGFHQELCDPANMITAREGCVRQEFPSLPSALHHVVLSQPFSLGIKIRPSSTQAYPQAFCSPPPCVLPS